MLKKWASYLFFLFFIQLVFAKVVLGAGAPNDASIGGGKIYIESSVGNGLTQGDYTINSYNELVTALSSAQSGDILFIPGNVEIDFTGENVPLSIPEGITLASDRGNNGSKGALLYTSSTQNTGLINVASDNVRITGFRLRGPHLYIQQSHENHGILSLNNSNFVVDNMEVFNWGMAGIRLNPGTVEANIHHNSIHHNQRYGLGYGVVLYGDATAVIHHNLFDSNRHSIAGSGQPGQGYEAYANIVFANANGHAFDMHGYYEWAGPKDSTIAGKYVNIHDNTFLLAFNAVVIRGIPTEGVFIKNNIFFTNADKTIRQKILGDTVVNSQYQGTFEVSGNVYSDNGSMSYADLEQGSNAMQRIPNDVFWAVPVSGSSNKQWYVSIDGTEPWSPRQSSGIDFNNLALGDFDNDGVFDVFNAGWLGWNISSGGNSAWQSWNALSDGVNELLFADINGDKVQDVIHKNLSYVSWNASSAWQNNILHNSVDFNQAFWLLDMGHDKQKDIVRVTGNVFEVSWGGQTEYEAVSNRAFIRSGHGYGDFDGDGRIDQFRMESDTWQVKYYGDNNFQVLSYPHNEALSDIALGDFDGDGKTDVFRIAGSQWQFSSGGVGAWQNLRLLDISLSDLAFGDFNGDGITDVFLRDTDEIWKVSWGGVTAWSILNSSGLEFSRFIFADFNGDGRTDVANANNGIVNVSLGGTQLWKQWD